MRVLRVGNRIALPGCWDLAVLRLDGVEVELMSEEERAALTARWRSVLNTLEGRAQVFSLALPADLSDQVEGLEASPHRGLARSLIALLREWERAGAMVHLHHIVLPCRSEADRERRLLPLAAALEGAGLGARVLDAEERERLLTLLLPPGGFLARARRLESPGLLLAVRGLLRLPRLVGVDTLTRFLRLPFPVVLSLHLSPIPGEAAGRYLEQRRAQLLAAARTLTREGRAVPSEVEVALEDLDRARMDVARGTERLFHLSVLWGVLAETEEGLRRALERAEAYWRGLLAGVASLAHIQDRALLSLLPLGREAVGLYRRVDTSTVAHLFPFSPPRYPAGREATLIGLAPSSSSPVFLSEEGAPNRNMVLLGQSGSGKSFLCKVLLLRAAVRGERVMVVDPEGEYGAVVRALGGRVLTPTPSEMPWDPMALPLPGREWVALRAGTVRRLASALLSLTPEEEREVERAARRAALEGARSLREAAEAAEGVARRLLREVPPAAPPEDGALTAPVLCLDLRLVEGRWRSALSGLLVDLAWSLAALSGGRRILAVDEVWGLLLDPAGAALLLTAVKRGRKHGLAVWTVTQDVQDLIREEETEASRAGRTVVQNSAVKVLMRQDPAAIPPLSRALGLSAGEGELLISLPRGQGLMISPRGRTLLSVLASPEEMRVILEGEKEMHAG